MYNVRHFNKEKYFLDDWYESRVNALAKAKEIRAIGNKARIVLRGTGNTTHYLVYYKLNEGG